jgi:hypothetical protein
VEVQLMDLSDDGEGTGVIVAWGVVGVVAVVFVDGGVVEESETDAVAVAVVAAALSKEHVLFP